MKVLSCVFLLSLFATNAEDVANVCRDYNRVQEFFPDGTNCNYGSHPTQQQLDENKNNAEVQAFLKEHCCSFGGGDRVFENDLVFKQLYSFIGRPISSFQDQNSPSQKALFWLVYEDTFPDLSEYLRIGQRFSLASFYFGLNGDNDWIECGRNTTTTCFDTNKIWMSGNQECSWAYLSCDRNLFVTEIIMRE